jgi:hypothetical protein
MTLGPRMDSSVIFVTNTQVVSGRRPRVSFTKVSFKMGRVSSDAVCRAHRLSGSFGQSSCDVRPGDGHESFGVDGHKACCLFCPSLGVWAVMAMLFRHVECVTRRREWWNRRLFFVSPVRFSSLGWFSPGECFWGYHYRQFLLQLADALLTTSIRVILPCWSQSLESVVLLAL